MDLFENIKDRIIANKAQLEFINGAIADEMRKTFNQRQIRLLRFLHSERSAHSLAIAELEALLKDVDREMEVSQVSSLSHERIINIKKTTENLVKEDRKAKRVYRIITSPGVGIGDALLITPAI
ncbi:hypothetical protein L0244_23175, partial [bacterium]|nr:hypothetical protein [bacterium]